MPLAYYVCSKLVKDHGDRARRDTACCTYSGVTFALATTVALAPAEERAVTDGNGAEARDLPQPAGETHNRGRWPR